MTKATLLILSLVFVEVMAVSALAQQTKAKKDSATKDYKSELPRIPPKSPAEALKSFRLHPGYSIQLVAAEPLIRDPVAMAFDPSGRIYVCEMPEYNQYANQSFRGMGSVKLLEDRNGDGRYETSHVFLDKVASPSVIECYGGGVFIGAVPNVLFCKDTNGDGKADIKKVVFKGFARDRAGEAMMNSLRWGLDNRFHMSTSLAGGNVSGTDGKKARSVRGRGFRFDPRTMQFDLTSGGGQHGMSMDDWGRKFVCSNSVPAQTLVYNDRYLPRNPYLAARSAAENITKGKYTKIFRISRVEPWRVLRTRLRSKRLVPGGDEGGKPSGFFTASTGITIFRGNGLGPVRGNLLVGEVSSNMIYRAKLTTRGVSLSAQRTGLAKQEFLASTDNWFRPVQMAHGPDGNLYVLDMYRELIEGAAFLPDIILKHLNVAGGVKKGRIYRLVRTGYKHKPVANLAKATTNDLVKLLDHPNGWTRDTASRLIYERQDRTVLGQLRQLQRSSKSALGRAHALAAIVGLGFSLSAGDLQGGLEDPSPRVRETAIRFAELKLNSVAVRRAVLKLRRDADIRIRFQLAFSLGDFPAEERLPVLQDMILREGADPWFRLALLSSAHPLQGALVEKLVQSKQSRRSHIRSILSDLVTQAAQSGRQDAIKRTVRSLEKLNTTDSNLASQLLIRFAGRLSSKSRQEHFGAQSAARRLLDQIVSRSRKDAVDPKVGVARRVSAVQSLQLAAWRQVSDQVAACIDPRQPLQVQFAAVDVMSNFSDDGVSKVVLSHWRVLGPQVRARATELLLSRTKWTKLFLQSYKSGLVRPSEVDAARMRLLQKHRDKGIAKTAKQLFSQSLSKRADVVKRYQPVLKLKGRRLAGKKVFKVNCSACHKLEGVGNAVGADLKAIKDRGSSSILVNILDPNREVKPKFVNYVVTTDKGVVLSGMILQETANNITLRKADGTNTTLLRVQIERIASTGTSFMPEGLEKKIKPQDMADLIEYLNSIEK